MRLIGNTKIATVRSATARETMKKFWTILNGLYVKTLMTTMMLPMMVPMIKVLRQIIVIIASHSGTEYSIPKNELG